MSFAFAAAAFTCLVLFGWMGNGAIIGLLVLPVPIVYVFIQDRILTRSARGRAPFPARMLNIPIALATSWFALNIGSSAHLFYYWREQWKDPTPVFAKGIAAAIAAGLLVRGTSSSWRAAAVMGAIVIGAYAAVWMMTSFVHLPRSL